ncbi:hypothetical protein KBI52_07500 [Microvirga sp. HBU67558]|uniref:AbiU2 domain-containing protein n=1 Tax=Microvirga TaxID=186650 RepID=UPI001B36A753|nr:MULTISPECIES: hypothetical protein [unclassified Microvirga]MBQ0820058.1 hypothetical protein [Microvirga sp. HBU67558]
MAAGEPQNFSHLTADERFFVAKNRLTMTSALVIETIRLNEQTRAFFESDFGRSITKAAHSPSSTLVSTVLYYEVVQLCRLWDKFDAGSFSLPTIAALLRDREVFPLVLQNLATHSKPRVELPVAGILDGEILAPVDMREQEDKPVLPPPNFKARIEELESCLSLIFEIESGKALERIRNHRDKKIAHPIFRTQAERKKAIDDVKGVDLDEVVNATVAVMTTLESVLTPTYADYADLRNASRVEAESFFSLANYNPDPNRQIG